MASYLVANCPTFGCYWQIPVVKLPTDRRPEFDSSMYMVVFCPNCQKEFDQLAAALDHSLSAIQAGKNPVARTQEGLA
jgi:hypothetical protein